MSTLLLVVAIVSLVTSGLIGLMIALANIMSDAPTAEASLAPMLVPLGVSAASFVAWWFW